MIVERFPDVYKRFACIGGLCPDTCCTEWEVVLDPPSLRRFQTFDDLSKEIAEKTVINEDGEPCFCLTPDKRCPFLREDGFCRIQASHGEASLADTCRRYPRLIEDYGGLREISLTVACPAVFDLLYDERGSIGFYTVKTDKTITEYNDIDAEFFDGLLSLRKDLFDIINGNGPSFGEKMREIFACVTDFDGETAKATSFPLSHYTRYMGKAFSNMSWLRENDKGAFRTFSECVSVPKVSAENENFLLRLLTLLLFQYLLQAVKDGRTVEKVKLCLLNVLFLMLLSGNKSREEMKKTAILYAKEIEHSEDNLSKVENMLHSRTAFDNRHFAGILTILAQN